VATIGDEAETGGRLSEAIREASWTAHGAAERSIFMTELLAGRIARRRYADLVGQLHFIYVVLEQAANAMRDHPGVAPFVRSELTRVPALEADLQYLLGPSWADDVAPTDDTQVYCDRLREVCFNWPAGFVAHHYVRYMGDLSGGQFIGQVVERTYDLHDHNGARFYLFDEIPDLNAFKDEYRGHLDRAGWDTVEKRRVIDEVLLAYRLNTRLLDALQ
jgi:heme oxygenase